MSTPLATSLVTRRSPGGDAPPETLRRADPERAVHTVPSLRRLFEPQSIALVGASARVGSFGARTAENLARFTGRLYLINPRHDTIGDQPCYRSLADLPETPDCVILATAKEAVPGLIEECIDAGAGGVILYASGFSETGEVEATVLQNRIAGMARDAGLPLVGPNAIGFVNFGNGAGATFLTGLDFERGFDQAPEARRIGLVSQSGALGLSLAQAMQRDVYFSHVLACGNSSDVDVSDCVTYLAADPACRVIACLLEGLSDPRRLERAARVTRQAGKPLIVCKMAKGVEGAQAAASHTGSLAGSHDAYRVMVARAGGIFVDDYAMLLEMAGFFAKAGTPTGDGAAVIATSGGAAIMAADAAEAAGVPLPQPDEAVTTVLKAHIPVFGSARNPCDVTAEVVNDIRSLTACVGAVLDQPDYGVVIVPHPLAYDTAFPRIALLDRLAGERNKVICMVWLSGWLEGPGSREIERASNLALFRSMDHCLKTVAAWTRWHAHRPGPEERGRCSDAGAAETARAMLAASRGPLTEKTAKAVLRAYGLPAVEERTAPTAAEARARAEEVGFPVALKIDSPDLPHKTEVGGLALGLADGPAVEAAFGAMMERVAAHCPDARLDGVLVQRMVPKGVEILVGSKVDPAFGPMVVVGFGGVLVELLRDSLAAPAPVSPAEAEAMLRSLRSAALLDGFRDLPAVDLPALSAGIARISECAADHPDLIAEMDVNPIICRGSDILAVDALIIPRREEEARSGD